jgi:hypothetical protein
MKLHELKQAHKRKSDYHEFIYKEWDGFEPDGFYVKPFDVAVEYFGEHTSYSDHPYQDSTAREHHPGSLSIESLKAAEDVIFMDETGKSEVKRFKKGTDLKDIPGYDASWNNFFFDKAVEDFGD